MCIRDRNGPARSVAQLLSDVDEKLYEKKRRLHIANAQYALLHSPQRSPGVDFTYDTIYLLDADVYKRQPQGCITVSIGAATTEAENAPRLEDLLSRADKALYEAKHEGRNCVAAYI